MDKILAALAEFKAYFAGIKEALAKLTAAEDRVKSLEAELATAQAALTEKDARITSLTTDLEKSRNEVTALKADLETEKQRTTNTLAAQGLPLDQLPSATTTTNNGAQTETAWAKYSRLLEDGKHREASEFYAANADAIFKSRP
jgi:predicted RNase H-like nuclease (RuvC/YqgF family)